MKTCHFKAYCVSFLFLILPGPYSSASANTSQVGMAVAVRGEVFAIQEEKGKRSILLKTPIYENDLIKTGKRGKIQIMFTDSTLISLGRNTEMKISEYNWNAQNKSGVLKTDVKEGAFRVMGGAIANFSPEEFKTETPSATIGIRGSMYAGNVSGQSLSVLFQGGKGIDIINSLGAVAITKPGYGTRVLSSGEPPLPPVKFRPDDLVQINESFTGDEPLPGDDPSPPQNDKTQPKEDSPSTDGDKSSPHSTPPPDDEKPAKGDGRQQPLADDHDPAQKDPAAQQDGEMAFTPDGDPLFLPDERKPPQGSLPPSDGKMILDPLRDPMTGEPMQDPMMADTFIDPMTGEPMRDPMMAGTFIDPMTGEPMKDPMMAGTFIDPMTGEPMRDPMMADSFINPPINNPPIDPTNYYDPAADPKNQTTTGGDPTATPAWMPVDGVDGYFGSFLKTGGTQNETIRVFMEVNWKAGTGFGIVEPATQFSNPAFFFGRVNGTSFDNIRLFGTDGPIAIEGNGTGSFSGLDHQFFDMNLSGIGFDLTVPGTPSRPGWNMGVTTGITPKDPIDATAPTGISAWKGYVVGISENTNNLLQRKAYMNSMDSDFSLTINRNTGTVEGDIFARQLNPASNTNANLNFHFGGAGRSAYILDDHFGALIDSGSVEDDNITATTNLINAHGNYITTEDPQKQFSEYASWGYWEMSHSEAGGTEMYHAHVPYSMWVAGEKTPTAYIQNLITNTSFIGRYRGPAQGMQIDTGGISYLSGGRIEMAIDFSNGSIAPWVTNPTAVSSRLTFDQVVLDIGFNPSTPDYNTVNQFGFNGIITQATKAGVADTGVISSAVNGAYFGPNANSIGGNFQAQFSNEQYIGIFGGNLVNGPPP